MAWTRVLEPKEIINGRLIMVETRSGCFYAYLIFPDNIKSFADESKIIRSGYTYSSWKKAMSEGKKYATGLAPDKGKICKTI